MIVDMQLARQRKQGVTPSPDVLRDVARLVTMLAPLRLDLTSPNDLARIAWCAAKCAGCPADARILFARVCERLNAESAP